jgi:hypothetical protein
LRSFIFFSSGRTSRREIRKLLCEYLFWRFKRAKNSRHGSKIHTHSFLFDDDDDDTERSIATTTAGTPYCALTIHSQNRPNHLSRQNSTNNYSMNFTRKASFFTCCGLTVNLSHKHSVHSSNGDIPSRRSTIFKSSVNANNNQNNSPQKVCTYLHSPKSSISSERNLRPQQTICLKLIDDVNNSAANRRRASTIVHCLRNLPSSTISNPLSTLSSDTLFTRRSISEENQRKPIETSTMTMTGVEDGTMNTIKDRIDSIVLTQNPLDEKTLPAYIIETC